MRRTLLSFALMLSASPLAAQDRVTADASAPEGLAVTVYRDPNRGPSENMNRNWPRGFAMISETRRVTLPPGQSTIRFEGVAEGMVAVSAIVTGLPGGTIEKNRNADLLGPAALVDGSLGNRVTITRSNPGSGEAVSEQAIIRTRADGGLVLQTEQGFEAVRCSGLPERLTFDRMPTGLSAQPVFTIDTSDESGGTYEVTLTYLAWGFDWQANYVATIDDTTRGTESRLKLMSWLTVLNDNGQSFENAEMMVIAGTLNVVSDFQQLSDPPTAAPMRLTCYPLGSSLEGSPVDEFMPPSVLAPPPPPPPAPMAMMEADAIVMSGARMESAAPMMATEEQLGDLKLYRVPENVSINAQGLKQIAFLNKEAVKGEMLYTAQCSPNIWPEEPAATGMLFTSVNDREHGLGVALPSGGIAFFEPSPNGELLVGQQNLRDYAEGQDVEIALGTSNQVYAQCENPQDLRFDTNGSRPVPLRTTLTNANPFPVQIRLDLGSTLDWNAQLRGSRVKDGRRIYEFTVPANGQRTVEWKVTQIDG